MNLKCFYCNWIGLAIFFEVDHRIPVSRNGNDDIVNKRIVCSGCNGQKGTKTELEYLLWRIFNSNEANYGPK